MLSDLPSGFSAGSARLNADRAERLQRTIQHDLIPRLMVSHRAGPVSPSLALAVARELSEQDLKDFLAVVRGPDDASSSQFVQDLVDEGIGVETIYLDLLAPTARQLGTLWESDDCDFVEVTVALGRMQRALRDLSHAFLADRSHSEFVGNVLLSCVPGEQHTLGVIMVGEFLLRDGWRVLIGAPWTGADVTTMISTEWYDVIGFSVGCENRLTALKREVHRLKAASRNPDVKVMVGGKVFMDDHTMVERVGADAWAADASGASQVARTLLQAARSSSSVAAPKRKARTFNRGHDEPSEAFRRD